MARYLYEKNIVISSVRPKIVGWDLEKLGILSLAAFLKRSKQLGTKSGTCELVKRQPKVQSGLLRTLLILWSPEYFQRLWCTFELVSFLRLKDVGVAVCQCRC